MESLLRKMLLLSEVAHLAEEIEESDGTSRRHLQSNVHAGRPLHAFSADAMRTSKGMSERDENDDESKDESASTVEGDKLKPSVMFGLGAKANAWAKGPQASVAKTGRFDQGASRDLIAFGLDEWEEPHIKDKPVGGQSLVCLLFCSFGS